MKVVFVFIMGILAAIVLPCWAIPQTVEYQGYLTSTDGAPLDTVVSISFRLYDAPLNGTALWTETQPLCTTRSGIFSVLLGSVTHLEDHVFALQSIWIGVTIGNNSEMLPRTFLTSVPYSRQSSWSDSVTPQNISALLEAVNLQTDMDNDGHERLSAGGDDCNDWDNQIYPGQVETCNGVDDDCDGLVDESGAVGCQFYHADRDNDGWGSDLDSLCLCAPDAPYTSLTAGDCNDYDFWINPNAEYERCNNLDDDCDGTIDEFVPEWLEECNMIDDDCNGRIDDGFNHHGCVVFFYENDGDGYYAGDHPPSACICPNFAGQGWGGYTATQGGDCDDNNDDKYPGAQEICNGLDDDCDGEIDEGEDNQSCTLYRIDEDGDGWPQGETKCLCSPQYPYTILWEPNQNTFDCNDHDDEAYPFANEMCDSKDNDCDGLVDEGNSLIGCQEYWADWDNDGFGVDGQTLCLCEPTNVYRATQGGDCDDGRPWSHPGAPEICDGLDNDCDGLTDEGTDLAGCRPYFLDADHDGFGSTNFLCLCGPSGDYTVLNSTDCDDSRPDIHYGAAEICDGLDNNCLGGIDEGAYICPAGYHCQGGTCVPN